MLLHYRLSRHLAARCASAAFLTAILQFPAYFSSCTKTEDPAGKRTQIYIQWSKNPTPEALDLLFFETEGQQKLDSYHQVSLEGGNSRLFGISGKGPRQLVAISGKKGETAKWADIINYGSLSSKTFLLKDENPYAPRLFAETFIEDETSRITSLPLSPMLSCIVIRFISCDFRERPYHGKTFDNTAIYITYAGSEFRPLGEERGPVSWINGGELDSLACLSLPFPEMVLQDGLGEIGPAGKSVPKTFYCYAGSTAVKPRLVLEGTVDGKTCYYPIEIEGLGPGVTVNLNINIWRIGTQHPDIPIQGGMVTLETVALPWDIQDAYDVMF